MKPFYETSSVRNIVSLGGGMQPATIEGRVLDGAAWTQSALQSVADDLYRQSVITAGDVAQMSVYDISGSIDSATVSRGGVEWEASVRPALAEALQSSDVEVVVRGRRETDEDGRVMEAEVGRLLIGEQSEALSVAAQSPSQENSGQVAALADVDGELNSDERQILEKREQFSQRW